MLYFIYKTTNLVTNKIYVGKRSTNNLDDGYLGSGIIIRNSIKKYGKENFKREILEFCKKDKINEREIFWIKELDARNPEIGYNISKGGDGFSSGVDHISFNKIISIETRQKMSSAATGRKMSKKTRDKISKINKGKIISDKQKQLISDSLKGRVMSKEWRKKMSDAKLGEKNYWFNKEGARKGKVNSKESNLKRSFKLKNHEVSLETRKKISQSQKGKFVPQVICPYCGKSGAFNIMRRWHFDNCKQKIICKI